MKRLDHSKVAAACRRLADRIENDGAPTIIVYIRTGGDEVGRLLSGMLGCSVVGMHIARPDRTGVYKQIARVSRLLGKIVYETLFLLDRPHVYDRPEIPKHADVLLVDDAIHTGETIRLARQWIDTFSPSRVRVATITDMRRWKDSDYHEFISHVSFPWSKNNQEKVSKVIRGSYFIPIDRA